jgi:hypothetical protein
MGAPCSALTVHGARRQDNGPGHPCLAPRPSYPSQTACDQLAAASSMKPVYPPCATAAHFSPYAATPPR